jgi:hypothetical protein
MKPSVKFAALLIATFCAAVTFPRLASAQTTSPDAYVYVINFVQPPPTYELDGFSADSTGALTPLPGSPFWTSPTNSLSWSLTHSANWLFISDGSNIYSFSIASNGALTLKSSINAQQFASTGVEAITALFLDHTWSNLYATLVDVSGRTTTANEIQAYQKNGTTGALTFIGREEYTNSPPVAFIGSNQYQYAYNVNCTNANPSWPAAARNNNGTLFSFSINPSIPSNPNGNYCAFTSAPDPANNLAVGLFPGQSGPTQLAVYTADSSGNLTTNSTAANMPNTTISVRGMSVSPAGNLLAVCGGGVQVFHFHGSNPITPYTKSLAVACFGLAWDKHNHLFAIENGKVRGWRITPKFWKAASPYRINGPTAITVVSK